VGKTTLINAIPAASWAAKRLRILALRPLPAGPPSGCGETTGLEAKPLVHRLLEVDPAAFGFKRNCRAAAWSAIWLVVDADLDGGCAVDWPPLLDARPPGGGLAAVGDVDQLLGGARARCWPDLINSRQPDAARACTWPGLHEVFRQRPAAHSSHRRPTPSIAGPTIPDLTAAARLRTTTDFYFLPPNSPEQAVAYALSQGGGAERIPRRAFGLDPIAQVQACLCPMGARWLLAPARSNIELPSKCQPRPPPEQDGALAGALRRPKVMQVATTQEKEVFNGDVGNGGTNRCRCQRTGRCLTPPAWKPGGFDGREVT